MPQKFYTADENGLVKVVVVPDTPAPEKQIKTIRNVERAGKDGKQKKEEEAPGVTIETWGQPDRNRAIQLMVWDHEKKHLVVARKNGFVQLLDPKDGSVALEIKQTLPPKQGKIEPAFVGIFANAKNLMTCTNMGTLTVYAIEDTANPKTINLGQNLCRMRVHPHDHHLVATCGNEEELTIWDLHQIFPEGSTKKANTTETKAAGAHDAKKNTSRHKAKDILAQGQLFKAKNVKNDFLDLRVAVWNTDFQFLDSQDHQHHRLAVGTRHHQLRVYDTKQARRPIVDAEIGTMPVVALANGKDATEIVFSDTVTNVFSVDTLTGAILGQYKGFVGVVTALACYTPSDDSTKTNLVTVSMDRHLRVHDMTGARKLLHKIYLKQRMTAVVVGEHITDKKSKKRGSNDDEEDGAEGAETDGDEDDDDEEDVWEQMGKLEEKAKKPKKTKSSAPPAATPKAKIATKKRKTVA